MKFTVEQLSNDVTKVALDGPLDSKGTGAIDLQFGDVANAKTSVVVDEKYMELAVRVLHRVFELDKAPAEEKMKP